MSKLYRDPKLLDYLSICNSLRSDEREQIEASSGQPYDPEATAMHFRQMAGPKWLICADDDRPVLVAGFQLICPGVYQDFMLGTDEAWTDHWRAIHKHARRCMDAMLEKHAHRLQCLSLASRTKAHTWYKTLGLEPEGVFQKYGANGEDFIMFARLRKG